MKRILMILLLSIGALSAFGSSGDGIRFTINDFSLSVYWPDMPEPFDWSMHDTIYLSEFLNTNYDRLSIQKEMVRFHLSETDKYIEIFHYVEEMDSKSSSEKAYLPKSADISMEISKILKQRYGLSDKSNETLYVYVVFIENEYFLHDSPYRKKLDSFLYASELYLTHPLALQNNFQGYVFSIFFRKEAMYRELAKLDIPRYVMNIKCVYEDKYDAISIIVD
ncbi:MAG: hypothetical protein JW904_01260 [Spirochaetales bacterium]|nr:hypothetical protein [Spirochaetales bacterium]